MDEKLIAILGGSLATLMGLMVWLIRYLIRKVMTLSENSIQAINNNTSAVQELKRLFKEKK